MSGGWTAEMLPALPDDGRHYEIIDGEMYVTPSPTNAHQAIAARLAAALLRFLDPTGIGAVIPDVDVSADERTMVRPDIVVAPFVGGRLPERQLDARALLLPVEILSPSSLGTDRGAKRRLYMRLSVPEYWIVDVGDRSVERWRPGVEFPEVVRERLVWRPEAGGPEVNIELGGIFEGT